VRRPAGRWAATVAVLAMLAMWGYVVYLAVGPGRQPPPDRLDDPAFAAAAQTVCRRALDDVGRLPPAAESPDPGARADTIDAANERFARMLDELTALAPPGADGEVVLEWLADWRVYLGDREAYAADLRTDPEARLLVTPKDREQVTEYIDAFAADNRMPACGTPLDVS
jgi:hypothetical protein